MKVDYFPIQIRYTDELITRIILKPEHIICGREFRVLKTRYDFSELDLERILK